MLNTADGCQKSERLRVDRSREIEALRLWIHAQKQCEWVLATFRADGAMGSGFSRSMKALDWTIDDAQRHWKNGKLLRFVPYIGGEPSNGVATHIHALVELPSGTSLEDFTERLEDRWGYFVKKVQNREVNASVWTRLYQSGEGEEMLYFARYEGPTFSMGEEKVMFDHLRLDAPVSGVCPTHD
jgi:hypothetical protein